MRATRRTWTAVATGLTLVLLAVIADRPLLMFGGLGIGAWLLARQYAAYRSFRTVHRTLSISVTPARDRALVEQEVRVTVTAQLDQPAPASIQFTIPRPISALGSTEADRTVSITRGNASAATTVTYSFPTAGRFSLPAPVVSITDDDGLFTETFERGESPVVQIGPADPGNAYIGRGGDVLATTYGEHPAARGGSGLTPAELREYLPGDSLDRIDWKATARLDTPYVREFEAETDRRTVLIVDHRNRMAHGRRGMTQFEYAREVALGFVRATESSADPLGCWTIGDTGVTSRTPPVSTPQGYATIRERLRDSRPLTRPRATQELRSTERERPSAQLLREHVQRSSTMSRRSQRVSPRSSSWQTPTCNGSKVTHCMRRSADSGWMSRMRIGSCSSRTTRIAIVAATLGATYLTNVSHQLVGRFGD